MVKVATKVKTDEKAKLEFLHSLYQQMLTGHSLAKPPDGSMLANFSWSELTLLINEQAAVIVNSLHRAEEKVSHIHLLDNQKNDITAGNIFIVMLLTCIISNPESSKAAKGDSHIHPPIFATTGSMLAQYLLYHTLYWSNGAPICCLLTLVKWLVANIVPTFEKNVADQTLIQKYSDVNLRK